MPGGQITEQLSFSKLLWPFSFYAENLKWDKSSQISFFSKCRSIFLPSYWIIKRNEHRYRIREKAGSIFVFSSFWFGGKKVQVSWIPSIKSLPRPNLKCVTLQRRKILSHFLNIDGVLGHVYFMLNNHHYNAFTFLSYCCLCNM